jgi:sugar phosphate isomerase/epimerase
MHNQDRRAFIRQMSLMTGGVALLGLEACSSSRMGSKSSIDAFGVQLYTLRDIMPGDPMGTIKNLSTFGFKQLEGYDGPTGMYWGQKPKEFKKMLDDLNMRMVSGHGDYKTDLDRKAAEAAEVGLEYYICPWVGPQKSMDDWKRVTDSFNVAGETCRKHGLRFAYHNHEYTFVAFSGMIPHDYIMQNTDPATVDHEMDMYWVITGGADPIDFLKRYPGRFRLCHIKDRIKGATERDASCVLGTGSIDYAPILRIAREQGMKYFITEQERYDGTNSLAACRDNAAYMRALKV